MQGKVSWLNLHLFVVKDVRKLIFKKLTLLERIIVEYLHGNPALFEKHKIFICEIAAEYGHLEVLKWARQNGCPWDEMTCSFAADGGYLEVLKWARENGCPWDEMTREYAERSRAKGRQEVLKWANENGCP